MNTTFFLCEENMLKLRCICYMFSLLSAAMVLVAIPVYGSTQTGGISMDKISKDFSSISGYLVEQAGEEYIIDLDASNGITPGDVFSISSKDKEIIHPVSGKVIGYLGKVKTLLAVTRTGSGYSFARLLPDSKKPERGDVISRYEKVPALFWDYTGRGRDMFTRLQSAIRQLEWVDYDPSQAIRPGTPSSPAQERANSLIFIFEKNRLEVRGPDFGILHTYGTGSEPVQTEPIVKPTETRPVSALRMPGFDPEPQLMQRTGQTVRYEESFPQLQTLATFSRPTAMADFVPTEKGKLLAITDGLKITLYRSTDKLKRLSTLNMEYPGQILSLGWWQPNDDGPLYLAVNTYYDRTYSDRAVWGYIFVLKENRLTPFKKEIPRILGTFDKNADGKPETLLAQEFDRNEIFGSRKWQGRISGDKLTWSDPSMNFPRNFNVIGSCLGDLTGNGRLETAFINNGKLFIYSGRRSLFISSVPVGGSDSVLIYDRDTSTQNLMASTAVFEIRPQVKDVDGDGRNELIVASMERGLLNKATPGIAGGGQSGLIVFKHKQNRFVNGTLGGRLQGHIQGLDIDSERVLIMVSKSSSVFEYGGKSSLLFFDLQQ